MSDDLISRQAAIELVDWYQHEFIECDYAFGELSNELSKLPSVQSERKRGKWLAIGNTGLAACECGFMTDRYSVYNFCPHCGAQMDERSEDGEIHNC